MSSGGLEFAIEAHLFGFGFLTCNVTRILIIQDFQNPEYENMFNNSKELLDNLIAFGGFAKDDKTTFERIWSPKLKMGESRIYTFLTQKFLESWDLNSYSRKLYKSRKVIGQILDDPKYIEKEELMETKQMFEQMSGLLAEKIRQIGSKHSVIP